MRTRILGVFNGKLARRFLALFFVSALAPTLLFGALAFYRIESELASSAARELARESKATRLQLEARLDSVFRGAEQLAARVSSAAVNTDGPTSQPHPFLRAAYLQRADGQKNRLLGEPRARVPRLSPDERKYLNDGGRLLRPEPSDPARKDGSSVVLLQAGALPESVLVAEVDPSLWLFDLDAAASVCILQRSAGVLGCPQAQFPAPLLRQIRREQLIAPRKGLAWLNETGEEQLLHYRTLYLGPRFVADEWILAVSEPSASLQSPLREFEQVVPTAVALAMLIVILLSVSQIRRCLGPLERLREGTLRVAAQDFGVPVHIDSGDEFEELANSFNTMSARLKQQFNVLETIGEIDRVVLSSLDSEHIVRTVLLRIDEIIPAEVAAMICADETSRHRGVIMMRAPGSGNPDVTTQPVELNCDEWRRVIDWETPGTPLLVRAPFPRYLEALARADVNNLLLVPIRSSRGVVSALCLGYLGSPPAEDDERLRLVIELANRSAVAMSNAAWEEKLYRQAHFDAVTQLPNRHLFLDQLERARSAATENGTKIALLFLDVDRFKSVNDSLGHGAGDALLRIISKRLAKLGYVVARFSGDEFLIIVPDLEATDELCDQVGNIAQKICDEVSRVIKLENRNLTVSASIGIALYPNDASDVEELMKNADSAMYQAKASGRNGYEFYAPEFNALAIEKLELASDLRRAIVEDQFEVYFQPKVNAATGALAGAEALVRWIHPVKGSISPRKFIPIAEDTGLTVQLGDFVLKEACAHAANWIRKGLPPISVAVNLSAGQFKDGNLIVLVSEALRDTGLPAECLELEVTEKTVMSDVDNAITTLFLIRDMGVRIAVDDFGTGYSSLAYLAQFSLNTLKVDQSFVRRIQTDPSVASIVTAIVNLAHSLGLEVVAEGVENEEQIRFLQALHCEQLQGYFYSRPVPADEFVEIIKRWDVHRYRLDRPRRKALSLSAEALPRPAVVNG